MKEIFYPQIHEYISEFLYQGEANLRSLIHSQKILFSAFHSKIPKH